MSWTPPGLPPNAWALFRTLPPPERFHVAARAFSAPLTEIAERVRPQVTGRVAELGCGHGLLSALIALRWPFVRVVGIDPDPRKISWAQRGPGRLPNLEFRLGTAHSLLPEGEGAFDALVICDVLYLLPFHQWPKLLETAARMLRPGGLLLLKEVEGDRSWRHLKAWLQEWVMTRFLQRTQSSGDDLTWVPRSTLKSMIEGVGLTQLEMADLRAGYTTPHLLYTAHRPA